MSLTTNVSETGPILLKYYSGPDSKQPKVQSAYKSTLYFFLCIYLCLLQGVIDLTEVMDVARFTPAELTAKKFKSLAPVCTDYLSVHIYIYICRRNYITILQPYSCEKPS